ncbi:MAG TPA: HAD hydrolase-like protein [Longimicrobiaceae bacterium]|nr:HAD hydrolase-like protein [Longimicrobiaceae bacterium]
MRRLILFDIDGTLLTTGRAAKQAFLDAMLEVYGTTGPIQRVHFSGKTDPQIARELLSGAGLPEEEIQAGLPALWEGYLVNLEREIASTPITVFPGVVPLLDRIEEMNGRATLGLLTGNLEGGARLKLDTAGIGFHRFAVGAYGSDHAERPSLPAIAVQRAEERFGHRFTEKSIVIIGDTPADISCGESLGVRTVAVATGTFTAEQLAPCGPDYLFPSLADTEAVWRAIFD